MSIAVDALYFILVCETAVVLLATTAIFVVKNRRIRKLLRETLDELNTMKAVSDLEGSAKEPLPDRKSEAEETTLTAPSEPPAMEPAPEQELGVLGLGRVGLPALLTVGEHDANSAEPLAHRVDGARPQCIGCKRANV
ncbi:MAG: hypothetical protein HGA78_07095, partial [Nitrospirales bacterium]|nr:hypothetical protein [Nitrospirales bacterium]